MKLDSELEELLTSGSEDELHQFAESTDSREILLAFPSTLKRLHWRMNWALILSKEPPKAFRAGEGLGNWMALLFGHSTKNLSSAYGPWGWKRQEAHRNTRILLIALLERADFRHTGLLCAALWPVRDRLLTAQEAVFDARLAPLLLALDEEQARNLSEEARRWLRWRLERRSAPEFRVAALLTLASGGDKRLAPLAAMLLHTADARVRAAADEALRIVRARR